MRIPARVLAALLVLAGCASSHRDDKVLAQLADLDKQTIYDRAEALYADEKYNDARELYSFLYDTFPNDPLGHKAALRVADTYAVRRDTTNQTEARLRYRDFANRYPNDPDRDYALYRLGETFTAGKIRPERDLSPLEEALDAYQQLITLYPQSKYFEEARARMSTVREALAEHEWLVARFYWRNRRYRGTLWRLEYLKEHYPEYSKMAEVDALLAEARATVERFDRLLRPETPEAKPDGTGASLTRAEGVG